MFAAMRPYTDQILPYKDIYVPTLIILSMILVFQFGRYQKYKKRYRKIKKSEELDLSDYVPSYRSSETTPVNRFMAQLFVFITIIFGYIAFLVLAVSNRITVSPSLFKFNTVMGVVAIFLMGRMLLKDYKIYKEFKTGEMSLHDYQRKYLYRDKVTWYSNAPAHWQEVFCYLLDPNQIEAMNDIYFAGSLSRALKKIDNVNIHHLAKLYLSEDGVIEVMEVSDSGKIIPVLYYPVPNVEAANNYNGHVDFFRSRNLPEPIYFSLKKLPATNKRSNPFRPLTHHDFRKWEKGYPASQYSMYWNTGDTAPYLESDTCKNMKRVYENSAGIQTYIYGSILYGLGLFDKLQRCKIPINPETIPFEGPEEQLIILSVSEEKGIQLMFPESSCAPAYRDMFWKAFADYTEKIRNDVVSNNYPIDHEVEEDGPLGWFKFTLEVIKKHQMEPGAFGVMYIDGDDGKGIVQDKDKIDKENNNALKMISESLTKKLDMDKITDIEGKPESLTLIFQLMDDFGFSAEDLLSESYYDVYRTKPDDPHYLILYRAWKDAGASENYDGVTGFFNGILVSALGIGVDWKYDDEEILMQLNDNEIIKKHKLEFLCSEHEWDEDFDIAIEKDGKSLAQYNFKYKDEEPKNAKYLIETINQHLESEGIIIVDADDGSDSFNFVIFEVEEWNKLKNKYGELLPGIVSPL